MPPGERRPSDDRGGDDVQLVALADVERRPVEPSRHDGRGQGAQDAHQHVRLEDRQSRVDATQLGGVGIAAVGVHVPTEPPTGGHPRHRQRHADEQDDRKRESGRDPPATGWRRPPALLEGDPLGEPLRPEVVVGEPGDAQDGAAADHDERDLRPHRPYREAVPEALAPPVQDDGDDRQGAYDREGPGEHLTERTLGRRHR